jgi:hypothetical protein
VILQLKFPHFIISIMAFVNFSTFGKVRVSANTDVGNQLVLDIFEIYSEYKCQAQAHVGLPAEAELMLSSMAVPSIFSKLF